MVTVLRKVAEAALDLLLPLSCTVCGREGRYLCAGCSAALPRLEKPHCSMCAGRGAAMLCSWCKEIAPAYDRIIAPYLMAGAVTEMVHSLKYRSLRASAPVLGGLMAAHLEREPAPADMLLPVPLHRRRKRERGYNQSALLAREVSKSTGIPVDPGALERTRDTPPQVSMEGHEERRRNMQGAFECISDVVVTTGSTMSACAAALKASGAESVSGLALARQG